MTDAPANATIPVIDVADLRAGDIDSIAPEIGAAARGIGFFVVTGHGIPPATRETVFASARELFALPMEQKEAISIERAGNNRGWVRLGGEALDPSRPADIKEAFNVGLELLPDDPDILARKPFRGANAWPDLPGFRAIMLGYFAEVLALGTAIHRAIARDLGLPPQWFDEKLDRPLATLRLLRYPPVSGQATPGAISAGEHTDYGNLTLLMTDDAGGLDVRTRDGAWIKAPSWPDAFIVNIGDCLMRWTNDVYVSTPHRVIHTAPRERLSVAFFLDANPDAVVAALPSCTSPDRPARYPATTVADYLRQRLDATYAHRRS